MNSRYFIFLYPDDSKLSSLLGLVLYILNPKEKWPAHITVGGPFKDKRSIKIREHFLADIFCLGVGNFFPQGGSTVYLRMGFRDRAQVWKKPDFTGQPIPHMTLYDGEDREFANLVFKMALETKPFFSFHVSGLRAVKSIKGQLSSDLVNSIDPADLPRFGLSSLESIRILSDAGRIDMAKQVLREAIMHAQSSGH